MFAPGTMLGRARNFFFGSSAAPEAPPEAPPEAKKRRGGAAPVSLMRLPDDALVSACAYMGLVDGACAAVTCRRLAAVGRNVHPRVLIVHRPLLRWGCPAFTLILDPSALQRDTTDDLRLAPTTEQRALEQRIRDLERKLLERKLGWQICADCPEDDLDVTYVGPVVIGGQLCSVTFPYRSERGGELQLPPMHVYSLKKNAWRTIDHFAHLGALTSFACCALGSELCFVGGTPLDTDDPSAMSAACGALINIVMWADGTFKFFELERVGPSTWAWREVSPPFPVEGRLAEYWLNPSEAPFMGFAHLRA
ncbi:hypothetical protein JL722_4311 [Aureococcus anophagefferens]|nr:hypothetical protein JL722_4311 [Aureococcus anophagefferens]